MEINVWGKRRKGKQAQRKMYVLNIEDNAIKHRDICKVLEDCGEREVGWVKNLEDGMNRLKQAVRQTRPYDLIITDMYYPLTAGGKEMEAGELLIQRVAEMGLDIPIILCSSVNYRIPEILGTVHYAEHVDWEDDLRKLVKMIKISER